MNYSVLESIYKCPAFIYILPVIHVDSFGLIVCLMLM